MWIIDLIKGLFSVWLGNKTSTAENLGKSEESLGEARNDANVARNDVAVLQAEAKAAANAPTSIESLIAEQRRGRI
jgi:hypothetical protein